MPRDHGFLFEPRPQLVRVPREQAYIHADGGETRAGPDAGLGESLAVAEELNLGHAAVRVHISAAAGGDASTEDGRGAELPGLLAEVDAGGRMAGFAAVKKPGGGLRADVVLLVEQQRQNFLAGRQFRVGA